MKTRYEKEKKAILSYQKKRREQIQMFFRVADLYEEGKLNPQEVLDLMPKIRDYKIRLSNL